MPIEHRFWSKVNKNGPIHPIVGQCWVWIGACNKNYGNIKINKKFNYSHRVSWELHNGPIPNGMCVLHHCDNSLCVNPKHLFLGTKYDNTHDCINKGRFIFPSLYLSQQS